MSASLGGQITNVQTLAQKLSSRSFKEVPKKSCLALPYKLIKSMNGLDMEIDYMIVFWIKVI